VTAPETAPAAIHAEPNPHDGPGLERNSLALAISALVTGALGLVYWALIGRVYPAREVGAAAAIITTATMLSAFGNLSFGALFERFIPVAGHKLPTLVRTGFVAGVAVSATLAVGFLWVGPTDKLFTGSLDRMLFPVVVVSFSVFALLDHTAVGLRRATWAAQKNITHAVAKTILVLAFAAIATRATIVWTWVGPAVLLSLVLGVVVIRRIRTESASGIDDSLPDRRELGTYLAGTYLLYVVGALTPLLMPLIVVAQLGTELNAYFAISWSLVTALIVLLTILMGPYIAAAAADSRNAYRLTQRFLAILGLVGVSGALFLAVAGPLLLSLVGPQYRALGGPLLQLAAIGIVLALAGHAYSAISRLLGRLRYAVAAQCVNAALMLGLGVAWVDLDGLRGLAYAFITAELTTALLVIIPLIASVRRIRQSDPAMMGVSR
jgi:O-antigen/teichoic acid export membrane protein